MDEKVTLRACPYCGSMDTHPALLFGGPIPWVDHNDGGYRCRSCGRTAVPLDFDNLDDLKAYQKGIAAQGAGDRAPDFVHIPILPVDTTAVLNIPVIDLPIGQVAEVVNVEWRDGRLARTEGSAKFARYWRATSSPRYSASEVVLLDLAGIREGRPSFEVLKALIKSKYQVWLDLGMRDIEDLYDSFAMDVSRAVLGTMTAPGLELFEEAFDLSDRVVPMVQVDREVLWPSRRAGPRVLEDAVAALMDIGYEQIGVLDLPRLGRRGGVDKSLVDRLSRMDAEIILGGGVVEASLDGMRAAGLHGAFMDPFTPVIDELLQETSGVATEDRAPAAAAGPAAKRTAAADRSAYGWD